MNNVFRLLDSFYSESGCHHDQHSFPTRRSSDLTKSAIDRAIDVAKKRGVRRALPLPVSAPFHCALMAPAAERLRPILDRSEEHTSELQSRVELVCRLLLEKKKMLRRQKDPEHSS